jgi:3-oxoacyl-[acyl-carrier protein] reductase
LINEINAINNHFKHERATMMLKDKVALITGGNRGIGAATAKLFAAEGAKVVITYSSETTKPAALEVIKGLDAIAVQCDVSDQKQVKRLIDATLKTFGKLNILVNNAGIMGSHTVEALDLPQVEQNFRVNVIGPVLCTALALNHLIATKGVIVNTASLVGLAPSFVNDIYSAAKHAVVGLTRSWAFKFGPRGVRVNAVAPGPITTDLLAPLSQETLDKMKSLCPLGRLGEPREVASAILFFASDLSSYVNGQTLVIDGGRVMH